MKHAARPFEGLNTHAEAVDLNGQVAYLKSAPYRTTGVKIGGHHRKHSKFVTVHGAYQPFTVGGLLCHPCAGLLGELFTPGERTKNGSTALFTEFFRERDVSKGRGLGGHH